MVPLNFNNNITQVLGFVDRSDPETMFDPEINFVVGKKQLGKIIDKCITKHGFTVSAGVLDAFKDTVEGYKLQSMGVLLSYICPLMYMNNPLCKKKAVITNSNKLRTYTSARYYTDAEILDILTGKEGR